MKAQRVVEQTRVTWKGRVHEVMGIGLWRREGGVEWKHPSSMPRGLRKAWREEVRRGDD